MMFPPALAPGARVALVAPAGPLNAPEDLDAATAQAERFGFIAVPGAHVLAKRGYLAGSDTERADDMNAALADRSIDAIWCVRGGYGAMRILRAIDAGRIAQNPRALIGFSDVTALHALWNNAGVVTFHGPNARADMSAFSELSLRNAILNQHDICGVAVGARTLRGGIARGRLVGGNLAVLAALCGTPYAPDFRDAILVLEDIGEATYRIDRLLQQLALSGALSSLAGIAFGQFTDGNSESDVESIALDDVLRAVADAAGVPAIAGIPMGHIDEQWTIPLGATAELNANAPALYVDIK